MRPPQTVKQKEYEARIKEMGANCEKAGPDPARFLQDRGWHGCGRSSR